MTNKQMSALIYEGPRQMAMREVPIPKPKPDEVLIKVVYSGICGSELSGFEGKNELRKPPLIMGHEFSGTIESVGEQVAADFPDLSVGKAVTANPLIPCGRCGYCLKGQQHLCSRRKLHSASLPGSNAQYITVRAGSVYLLPEGMPMHTAALVEPTACGVHAARLAMPMPGEEALVVGAGPIGLLTIQALQQYGLKAIYCAELNKERLAMADAMGALPVPDRLSDFLNRVDIAVDAVGIAATRQACVAATRAGGRVVWIGLHEPSTPLPINDMIRREIAAYSSYAYTPTDFSYALTALAEGKFWLEKDWTRIEPLANGSNCFDELIKGAAVAKIWLEP
jgi:2-desacetyl-2-hydroxyethyl bacteriochlorophyllide A dehydrogenase